MALPLVSCLMVTRNRPLLARRAIECFSSQTWPNKELVIVDDGEQDYRELLARYQNEHRITYERLPPQPNRTLGAARNVSLELATGEYCVQWDDDEWYHPDRIAVQMGALTPRTQAVVLKYTLMHLDTPEYIAHPYRGYVRGGTPGTVLHRRSSVRYPQLRKNEDSIYLVRLRSSTQVGVLGKSHSHLFVRCFHGENTWTREHFLRRLHTTRLDQVRYFVAVRLRRDLFSHPAFQLRALERDALSRFLSESRASGLLRNES